MPRHLHGCGRDSRNRFPIFLADEGQVADRENLGMARHAQIPIDLHPPGAIEVNS